MGGFDPCPDVAAALELEIGGSDPPTAIEQFGQDSFGRNPAKVRVENRPIRGQCPLCELFRLLWLRRLAK